MKPAPPVTSSRNARRLAAHLGEACAKTLAPVRKDGRAGTLAAEHRVRGPGSASFQLHGRDSADTANGARLLEDRLREVGPRAVASGSDVPEAPGTLLVHQLTHRLREGSGEGRRATLVVDDLDLVAFLAEPEHRAEEVVTDRAEQP